MDTTPPPAESATGGVSIKNPPTRILVRSDSSQIRLQHVATLHGIDVRIHRKTAWGTGALEPFVPTDAGFVLPLRQAREFLGHLGELLDEINA